ncbi:MAG: hypothetical protein IKQ60_02115 [Candidatus Methanomethylophilaceae archaeon]|nr:hypothetical protein [Candidatus Methanomethylophilaceae archaeon]
MNRPYAANYAIGFMFVVGMTLLFEAMCALSYSDTFGHNEFYSSVVEYFTLLSVLLLLLAGLLLAGMPVAQKASIAVMAILIALEIMSIKSEEAMNNDYLMTALGILSVVLLMLKPSREYYAGWGVRMRSEDAPRRNNFIGDMRFVSHGKRKRTPAAHHADRDTVFRARRAIRIGRCGYIARRHDAT